MTKQKFDIGDFQKQSQIKFYYQKGRHANTSLREYEGKLYVHKLLGNQYRGVSKNEYLYLVELMKELYDFLQKQTKINLVKTFYVDYNAEYHCIERVEKYSGNTLAYHFPTVTPSKRKEITSSLLNQIRSLISANRKFKTDDSTLKFTIDTTPDNFTYDGKKVYFIDFMPPLAKEGKVDPQFLSDKLETSDLGTRSFRYFSQEGLYLTLLTKFGSADITFAHELYRLTMQTITNSKVKAYLHNEEFKILTKISQNTNRSFSDIEEQLIKLLSVYGREKRDLLRLYAIFFITDYQKILSAAKKYREKTVVGFLKDKRCTADIIKSLIYSDLRKPSRHEDFKELVINLVALQYES